MKQRKSFEGYALELAPSALKKKTVKKKTAKKSM